MPVSSRLRHLAQHLAPSCAAAVAGAAPASETDSWDEQFTEALAGLRRGQKYGESAAQLREIVRSGLLPFQSLHDAPERFFLAHRLLADHATTLGPGFFIRFTVQYNLFAGTVVGLGSDAQLAQLEEIQAAGQLGCFALTEKFAGVNSGLVVNTEAHYDEASRTFRLHTPNSGAEKNWISQGFVADKAVVVATLYVRGASLGPHAFLMDFRTGGDKLVPGVAVTDMGEKSVGNDLDNASIRFTNVVLPREALLSRFAEIDDDGNYKLLKGGIRPFEMIGQRLFTGRIAVAQAALAYRGSLYASTRRYADAKHIWSPASDGQRLAHIPQLRELFDSEKQAFERTRRFVAKAEAELCACLRGRTLPPLPLQQAIAVSKVTAVEESIEACFRLKQEVGSYALMAGSGFEQADFLQCCKFAEGDSRILMLKMARDGFSRWRKKGAAPSEAETQTCQTIQDGIEQELAARGDSALSRQQAWDAQYKHTTRLASQTIARVTAQYLGEP